MGIGNIPEPAVGGTLARPTAFDPYHFTARMSKGKMDCKTHTRLQCLGLIVLIGHKLQFLSQRNNSFFSMGVFHLCHTIPKIPKMGNQFPSIALMTVANVSISTFSLQPGYCSFFQGFEYPIQDLTEDHWGLFFQSLKNSIDSKSVLWYSKLEDEINFEFFHRAIPPCGGWCYH